MTDEKNILDTANVTPEVQPVSTDKPATPSSIDQETRQTASLLAEALELVQERKKQREESEAKQKAIDEQMRKYDPFYKAGKYAIQELGDVNIAENFLSDAKTYLKKVSENINLPVEEREEIIQEYMEKKVLSYKQQSQDYQEKLQAERDRLSGLVIRKYGEMGAQTLIENVREGLSYNGAINDEGIDKILSIMRHGELEKLIDKEAEKTGLFSRKKIPSTPNIKK